MKKSSKNIEENTYNNFFEKYLLHAAEIRM